MILLPILAGAGFKADRPSIQNLPAPGPHWVWAIHSYGEAYLLDFDSGRFLGSLNTGNVLLKLDFAHGRPLIYAAETYFSRGKRGVRTDLVSIYEQRTLAPVAEVEIPAKRFDGVALTSTSALTGDDRFMLVFNMTPGQSVSVVDLIERKFVGELETPGCALIYPSAERRFNLLCGDGSMLTVSLDKQGRELERRKTQSFFDPGVDPVMEKAVRNGDTWYFVSFRGQLHALDLSGDDALVLPFSKLITEQQREMGWWAGGAQPLAIHRQKQLLYLLVHNLGPGGGVDTHKDPGTEVWIFDLQSRQQTGSIVLRDPASAILVTQDKEALLLAAIDDHSSVLVYDAFSGKLLRSVDEIGRGIDLLQAFP